MFVEGIKIFKSKLPSIKNNYSQPQNKQTTKIAIQMYSSFSRATPPVKARLPGPTNKQALCLVEWRMFLAFSSLSSHWFVCCWVVTVPCLFPSPPSQSELSRCDISHLNSHFQPAEGSHSLPPCLSPPPQSPSPTFCRESIPLPPLLLAPWPPCKLCPPTWLAGHRRLMVRATVRIIPSNMRKGSQVFKNPAQLEIRRERQRGEGKESEQYR